MTIRVAILEDHQGIIDGYRYRLDRDPEIRIVGAAHDGEAFETLLARTPADVALLDVYVPASETSSSPFPIHFTIPRMLETYPDLVVIVISVVDSPAMIQAVLDAGASAYILKADFNALKELDSIIRSVAQDGFFLSKDARAALSRFNPSAADLTPRQREALSLCAAYPELKTSQLAQKMEVAHSTYRNFLSGAYFQLNVANRASAILRAQQLGLIPVVGPDR
jgi:DNA-binding NarL/FixJ family response regulator